MDIDADIEQQQQEDAIWPWLATGEMEEPWWEQESEELQNEPPEERFWEEDEDYESS
jgi:hypothetical protein